MLLRCEGHHGHDGPQRLIARNVAVEAKGEAPKVINIMAALKKSVQAKGRAKVKEAVRKRSVKPPKDEARPAPGARARAGRSLSDALDDCRQTPRRSRRRIPLLAISRVSLCIRCTIKRVKTARLSHAIAMTHYRRVVDPRRTQKRHC